MNHVNSRSFALAALCASSLLLSGCVGSGFRSSGFRGNVPAFPTPGGVGDGTPSVDSAPAFQSSTPSGAGSGSVPAPPEAATPPAAPKTFESDYGPTLSVPEAKRRAAAANQAAYLEAPPPKHSDTGIPLLAARFAASGDRSLTRVSWNRYFRSTDRRMIDSVTLGDGPTKIAILASVHGDQPQSVALVDLLAQHLSDTPALLAGRTVLIVRNPNPDGLFARTPANVQGVDLNRNFPASNWRAIPEGRAGESAASEPETRAIVRMLLEFQPTLVIHVKDYDGGTYLNTEGTVPHAQAVATAAKGEVVRGLGAKTTGSLEAWSVDKLSAGTLTFLLPDEQSPARAWNRYREPLVTAIRDYPSQGTPSAKEPDLARQKPPAPPTQPASRPSPKKPAVVLEEDLDDIDADRSEAAPSTTSDAPAEKPRAPQIDEVTEDDEAIERPGRGKPVPAEGYFELPEPPQKPE
jgi:murein peptide amidase A